MKKGISTIIASIILVVITIGLISTAYLYFAGIVSVGPVLAIANAYCDSSYEITVTVRNDGTESLTASDINWLIDGASATILTACSPTSISAGGKSTCGIDGVSSGVKNILAIGPRNQAGGPVTCP